MPQEVFLPILSSHLVVRVSTEAARVWDDDTCQTNAQRTTSKPGRTSLTSRFVPETKGFQPLPLIFDV